MKSEVFCFLVVIALAKAMEVTVEETTMWENYKVSMYNIKLVSLSCLC